MAYRGRYALGPSALALLALCGACRAPQSSPAPLASTSQVVEAPHGATPGSASVAPGSASVAPGSASVAPGSASVALAVPAPSSAPRVTALLEPTPLVVLAVPGFRDAVVSVPLGATEKRVVALALHGNFDRPEWQCEVWRRITQGSVFVLCPRGIPRTDVPKSEDRWEWSSVAKTKAELVAALAALRARYPDYVESGQVVFTGFSLGAILGARLLQDPELDIGAAVLIEGGYAGWSTAKVKAVKPRLGRILFGCGQSECRNAYRYQLERLFMAQGVPASMVADVKAGHTYDDPVASLVQKEWPSILASLKHQ